jgi:Matrixin
MILATALASAAIAMAGAAPAPATLQGDLDAAAAYWQAAPAHCSTESVASVKLPRRVLGEGTIPDPSKSGPCVMEISPGMNHRLRCLVVVHEYGHWLGLGHSIDPHDPMFAVIDPKNLTVPECEHD